MAQVNPDSIGSVVGTHQEAAATAASVAPASTPAQAGQGTSEGEQAAARPAAAKPAAPRPTAVKSTLPTPASDSARLDSSNGLIMDSLQADTLPHDTLYYILLQPPQHPALTPRVERHGLSAGLSWIMGGLLLLFVIIAIRFHNNSKYLGAMFKSAFEVRERGNVFDDTVRETSFVILLNVMWSACVGILLYLLAGGSMTAPDAAVGMGISVGLTIGYELFITAAYWMVGNVFSDRLHTRMWLRGFLSATGLTTLLLFPVAMMALCYPGNAPIALEIGIVAVILGKIIFIWKGFRIFFSQIGSWVLFLYYLCSLEIVPLVLLYAGVAILA